MAASAPAACRRSPVGQLIRDMNKPYDHDAVEKLLAPLAVKPPLENLAHEEARQLLMRLGGTAYAGASFNVELRGDVLTLALPQGGPPVEVQYVPSSTAFHVSREGRTMHWGLNAIYNLERKRLEDVSAFDEDEKDALVRLAQLVARLFGPDEDFTMGKVAD